MSFWYTSFGVWAATLDPVLLELIQTGGTVAILWGAVWFMARTLREQYEDRITKLEEAVRDCERDREKLHAEILQLANCQAADCPRRRVVPLAR